MGELQRHNGSKVNLLKMPQQKYVVALTKLLNLLRRIKLSLSGWHPPTSEPNLFHLNKTKKCIIITIAKHKYLIPLWITLKTVNLNQDDTHPARAHERQVNFYNFCSKPYQGVTLVRIVSARNAKPCRGEICNSLTSNKKCHPYGIQILLSPYFITKITSLQDSQPT